MATSEIEKLERRYAENPHGLTFAPLAEIHRKNGDVARALELLNAGLELHPNYIPASIVLGRCHQDLTDLPSAEAAFAHVLRLDDENVIALKSLADINERLERYEEAEGWLRRLVSVDRSNEDAKEQLRRVEAARQSEAPESPTPAPVLEMIDLSPQPAVADEPPAAKSEEPEVASPELLPVEIAALDLSQEPESREDPEETVPQANRGGPAPGPEVAASAADIETRTPLATLPDEVSVAGVVLPAAEGSAPPLTQEPLPAVETIAPLPGLISAEFQPPLEATGGLGVETSEEVVLEVSGNSEFRVPDASEDLKALAARASPPSPSEPVKLPEAAPSLAERTPEVPSEPEFVVTETMAEVLAQQGHPGDALRVYRELARRSGGDAQLESRMRELEAALTQQQERQSYLARDTNGQSVGAFFSTLLAARPPAATGVAGGQNGGFQALGFGGEGEEKKSDPAVSFDDFFGSATDRSSSLPQGKSDPGKDDLDQFQSWLQNLKR